MRDNALEHAAAAGLHVRAQLLILPSAGSGDFARRLRQRRRGERDQSRGSESEPHRHARVPENGNAPIMPVSAVPEMLLPSTMPLKVSVSANGLVIEIFHDTSLPETLPSKMSVEPWSPPCLPISVSPADCNASVALRSPIGVFITIFQLPSAAMFCSQGWRLNQVCARNGIIGLAQRRRPSCCAHLKTI